MLLTKSQKTALAVVAMIYLSFFIAAISLMSHSFSYKMHPAAVFLLVPMVFIMLLTAILLNHLCIAKKFGHTAVFISELMVIIGICIIAPVTPTTVLYERITSSTDSLLYIVYHLLCR